LKNFELRKLENNKMNNSFGQHARKTARIEHLYVAVAVLGYILSMATSAAAQRIEAPIVPDAIKPPVGNTAFLVGHAIGTQGYTCLPTSTGGTSWTINPARPEATLFVSLGRSERMLQIMTHFTSIDENPNDFAPKPVPLSGNATWQSSSDTSRVWAVRTGQIDAGSDASCPNTGAIPCLLLQSIGNQEGPTGGKLLSKVTFIQRLNTTGGAAPTTACTVGQTQLVGYMADYYFFRAHE
jgi:hypothetical protein